MTNNSWVAVLLVFLILMVAVIDHTSGSMTDFYDDSTFVAQRTGVNLISGTGITVTGADAPANSRVDFTIALTSAVVSSQYGEMVITADQTVTMETADTPIAIKDFSTGLVNSWTFTAGDTGAVTAYADHGGTVAGTVLVTDAAHGRSTGDFLTIRGTADYNGAFEITKVTDDTFYIVDTWVNNNGASDWEMGAYLTPDPGAEGVYTLQWATSVMEANPAGDIVQFEVFQDAVEILKTHQDRRFTNNDIGAIAGGALLNVSTGDRIWMALESDGTNDITIRHLNLNLHRL